MEFTIAGKRVVVKQDLTLEDGYDIFGLLIKVDSTDVRTQVPLAVKMIESWEFEGDPHNLETYNKMDVIRVLIPLFRRIIKHVNDMMSASNTDDNEESKN